MITAAAHSSPAPLTGRFAPSPTGRMHFGNIFTAVISHISAKSTGGRWILRIEDLDPQRSRIEYARQLEDDLLWLGLEWDEGGTEDKGPNGPYCQSLRGDIYAEYFEKLKATGLTYPCVCTRADIMATQAPHQSDGRVIYAGTCRPEGFPETGVVAEPQTPHATRLYVPGDQIRFSDSVFGAQSRDLAAECGDFVVRRADGAWAYQLAVVVDDALMGVNEVVRGSDLLLSAAQQIYLCRLLGLPEPHYSHLPLICNSEGCRLSKRDSSLSMETLRMKFTPEELLGKVAYLAGFIPEDRPVILAELISRFSWERVPRRENLIVGDFTKNLG